MRFLIIILCLLSERFITHELQISRKHWLDRYSQLIKKYFPQQIINSSNLGLYLSVLLSLLFIAGLFALTTQSVTGFVFSAIFEFVVFYWCLGEHNLFFMNANTTMALAPKEYILAINQECIAIILWFFVFGPAGAILYRVTLYFSQIQDHEPRILNIRQIIDWLPSRITSIIFLIVGKFQPGMMHFIHHLRSKSIDNTTLLLSTAKDALDIKDLDKTPLPKLEELFTHSCLVVLFVIAIYMIGRLL